MLDDDDRRRAGQVMGNLRDRQQQMGSDDPFSLMKTLTETFKGPSEPINFKSYLPGGANFKPMNLSSYSSINKKMQQGTDNFNITSGFGTGRERGNHSPLSKVKERGLSNPINQLAGYSVGGVSQAGANTFKTSASGHNTSIGPVIKNKDIFEKAQQNAQQRDKSVDWYSKLQESKEAFHRVDHGRLPLVEGGKFRDPSGAFDNMISAKKEAKDTTAKKIGGGQKQFKLSKDQEIQIGLDMIPMYQAKEEELQQKHQKLKGLRQEIQGYIDEQGYKIRYAQPLVTTHFMNRKIMMPKKSVSGVSQNDQEEQDLDRDVTANQQEKARGDSRTMNADLDITQMQNSAIFSGIAVGSSSSRQASVEPPARRSEQKLIPLSIQQKMEKMTTQPLNQVQPPNRANKWTSACIKSLKVAPGGGSTQSSHRKRDVSVSSNDRSRTRSVPAHNQPVLRVQDNFKKQQQLKATQAIGIDPIKTGCVQLRPLRQISNKNNADRGKNAIQTSQQESGILEERGESTCSSKNNFNPLKSDGGLYPKLKDKKFDSNTRNSINIMDSSGYKNGRLDAHGSLKMPPVSTAVAKRRQRQLNTQESLGISSKSKQNSIGSTAQMKNIETTNITESQKRIRAILDKNLDRSITSQASNEALDAIGSFTINKPPQTHRDLNSIDGMDKTNTVNSGDIQQTKMSSTMQQNQLAIEVTDRLYNKKKIQKVRNKTSHGNNKSKKASANHKHNQAHHEKLVTPKNKDHSGNDYQLIIGSRFSQKEKQSTALEKNTINSNGVKDLNSHSNKNKDQKRQQISHNNAATSLQRHSFKKLKANKQTSKIDCSSENAGNYQQQQASHNQISSRLKKQQIASEKNNHRTNSHLSNNNINNNQFADKVAKLKEIKTQQSTEEILQPLSFRIAPNQNNEEYQEQNLVQQAELALERKEQKRQKVTIPGEKKRQEIDTHDTDHHRYQEHTRNHHVRRSSSVSSKKNLLYQSFQKDGSKSNLMSNIKKSLGRNTNKEKSSTVNNGTGALKKEQDAVSNRRSRLHSTKRHTENGYDMASSHVRQSKNFSSRRDLKELIFVDQKAFAANIDFLNNPNSTKKSPILGKRQSANQSTHERQSNQSRTQRRRNTNETPSIMQSPINANQQEGIIISSTTRYQGDQNAKEEIYIQSYEEQNRKETVVQLTAHGTPVTVGIAMVKEDDSILGKKRKQGSLHKDVQRQSLTRARDEHRRNLNEISKINDSVKYSPRNSSQVDLADNLNQNSVFQGEEEYNSARKESTFGSGGEDVNGSSAAVNQSVAQHQKVPQFTSPLDELQNLNGNDHQHPTNELTATKSMTRVQSTEREREISGQRIDMLQQNLQKLEKLERRLMRGRGHRKKSSRAPEPELLESTKITHSKGPAGDNSTHRKTKKKGKHWRFAYDLYCKELISSNQAVPLSQRSIEKPIDKQGGKQQQSQKTSSRLGTSNSNRREKILRQIAANSVGSAQVYLGAANVVNPKEVRSCSSKATSQCNSVRRQIHTATEQFSQRQKVRNSTCRKGANSRISTAGAGDTGSRGLKLQEQYPEQAIDLDIQNEAEKISYVEYPVAPTQPMLTERSLRITGQDILPDSLQQSPDRDDIILFAPLQTSPLNGDLQCRNFNFGSMDKQPTIESTYAVEYAQNQQFMATQNIKNRKQTSGLSNERNDRLIKQELNMMNQTAKNIRGKRQQSQTSKIDHTTEAQLEATYCQNTNSTMLDRVEKRKSNFNVKLDKRFNRQLITVNSKDKLSSKQVSAHQSSI